MKTATRLTFVVVTLIALLHLLRLLLRVHVTVGDAVVPVWASIPAAVFFGGLAWGLWREHAAPRSAAV
jgi:hypothetical protein